MSKGKEITLEELFINENNDTEFDIENVKSIESESVNEEMNFKVDENGEIISETSGNDKIPEIANYLSDREEPKADDFSKISPSDNNESLENGIIKEVLNRIKTPLEETKETDTHENRVDNDLDSFKEEIKFDETIEDKLDEKNNENKNLDKYTVDVKNTPNIVFDTSDSPKIEQQVTKEQEKKDAKELAINQMSLKYGMAKEDILYRIERYVSIVKRTSDIENEQADENYIKKAILTQKRLDETNVIDNIIEKIITNIISDIKDDNTLEALNKTSVYKTVFLPIAKDEILNILEDCSIAFRQKEFSLLEKSKHSDILKLFQKKYNILEFDLDINTIYKLFTDDNSLKQFIILLSMFYDDKNIQKELIDFTNEFKQLNLSTEKFFLL